MTLRWSLGDASVHFVVRLLRIRHGGAVVAAVLDVAAVDVAVASVAVAAVVAARHDDASASNHKWRQSDTAAAVGVKESATLATRGGDCGGGGPAQWGKGGGKGGQHFTSHHFARDRRVGAQLLVKLKCKLQLPLNCCSCTAVQAARREKGGFQRVGLSEKKP